MDVLSSDKLRVAMFKTQCKEQLRHQTQLPTFVTKFLFVILCTSCMRDTGRQATPYFRQQCL